MGSDGCEEGEDGGSGKAVMVAARVASWFETRGFAALVTMRIQDLILRGARKRRLEG